MAKQRTEAEEKQHIEDERARNAKGGFFHDGAVWLLSRFPLTKTKYQNWTRGRRILVGWLLWLVCLPIIPAVAIALWYFNDPEGFKQSPWAKGLIALFVAWAGMFGWIATNQATPDIDGIYSPTQTKKEEKKDEKTTKDAKEKDAAKQSEKEVNRTGGQSGTTTKKPDGETKVVNTSPAAVASEESKKKVKSLSESRPTNGRTFENCTEAFEAGVFNIRRSDASYQSKLDRDDDGIACER